MAFPARLELLRGGGKTVIPVIAMRVTCPRCSTEYDVPDDALAAGSRRLRCDRCGHQWRQEVTDVAPPEPVAPVPETLAPPEAPKPERVTAESLPKLLTKRDPRGDEGEGSERRRGIGVESQPRRPVRSRRGQRWRILLLVALIIIVAAFFVHRSF
jgi:predicted Zn finger-like uncharacterized protein